MDKSIITPSIKLEFTELHIKQLVEEHVRKHPLIPDDGKIDIIVQVSRGYEDRMSSTPDTVKVTATWKP